FLISSIFYTLIGMAITIVLFYFFLSLLQPYLETFFLNYDFNLLSYFQINFWRLCVLEFAGAALINMIASLVAVRKYSNV
ncbi:MAG TPA: hypothetical protein PK720_02605, partial [bacterium]|nr:hypothetical protein [bacterium]